ncbi:MAG: ABC transporter substrate-binding protein [Proteobacteria bacterium]|nr:ABC transporter substrate-binding protein [Pseudomonadota bacterium]MDA1024129.1 ABC transporter substrate-binding protein [Pseudomonadota bacterium]
MTRRFFLFFIVIFTILHAAPADSLSATLSPGDIVRQFQSTLLAVMKEAKATNVRQRFDRLDTTVQQSFHLPLMTQIAAGSHWNKATPTERGNLVSAFTRMSISTLATLFDGYSGEVFKVVDEKPGPQKTHLVVTKLVKSDKSSVDIAYVTRSFPEGWRIIDVIVDSGISELMVRRSEYRLVLKNKGIPGLVSLLNDKADELVSQ